MPVYNINGQELHTVEEGNPNRQKAILIHGWSSSSFALSPISALLSQRFHCISVDLPGYGNSPPMKDRVTIQAYAELLADFIEQHSDGPVVLIGHSMGGMTSINLALTHPILVQRMVLISPTITGRLSTMINTTISPITLMERFGLGQFIISAVESLFVGITDRLMRPISFADRSGITQSDYARLRADARRPGQGRTRAECYYAMRDNDLSERLGQVETPALVIWGAEDNTVPLRDAGVVADLWPNADLRLLPKAGHWPHFEAPEATRRAVASYLGLPLLSDKLHAAVDDAEIGRIDEAANFLAHSGIGNGMNLAQRTRLAAQLRQYNFPPYRNIVSANTTDAQEMYIIQGGTVEVWADPENPGDLPKQPRRVASLKPGEMTGELAMLDQGLRTADLISGPEGAVVLALDRQRLLALAEDDPEIGSILLWNIAKAMSQRVRFILWQLQRANQRARTEEKMLKEERVRQSGQFQTTYTGQPQ
ncbi:MAG: alpha/beta fold hydrolase [Anaerolineae bacterium]|nr:MAG: alpha/beta fold hydrolase [Anaerolineae bacterium]